jgi:alpha-galactosidase
VQIKNKHLLLTCEPENGVFSLSTFPDGNRIFKNARLGLSILKGNHKIKVLSQTWQPCTEQQNILLNTPHGKLNVLEFNSGGNRLNLFLHITFALPEEGSFLLWKMDVVNLSKDSILIGCFEMCALEEKKGAGLDFIKTTGDEKLAFFSNGWQSWNYTAVYGAEETMRQSNLGILQNPQYKNVSTPAPRRKGIFTSDFFGVIGSRSTRKGLLLGFLSQKEQFGSIQVKLQGKMRVHLWAAGDHAQLNPGLRMKTDWACAFPMDVDQKEPFVTFTEAVARENEVPKMKPKPTGWCSWYEFYTKIDDEKINRNIQAIRSMESELPLDLIQIDDGFEAQIGDWLMFKKGFQKGMKPHASAIRASGRIPGLWLAPFIVHRRSRLMKEHPEHILRNPLGFPVNSGFNWGSFTTSLDLTRPDAMEYACSVVRKAVRDWGFEYLKLDFLYAAALRGRFHDSSLTRAQVLRKGMEAIRKAVGPDVFLLGCGAPLGSMIGLVDAMRIGADVLASWRTIWYGIRFIFRNEPHTPSAKNSIHNMLTRSFFHNQWWINDPDVLLVRDKMELNLLEVRSLASMIFMTAGMVLLSDDLPKLTTERLEVARAIIPPLDQRPCILDWFDRRTPSKLRQDLKSGIGEWSLVSLSNWEDGPRNLVLDLQSFGFPFGCFWGRSFWDGKTYQIESKKPLTIPNVAPHATIVLAVRRKDQSQPQYIGSSLHLSQGMEIAKWEPRSTGIDFDVDLPRTFRGEIELSLPRTPFKIQANGTDVLFESLGDSRFRFFVEGKTKKSRITIQYK